MLVACGRECKEEETLGNATRFDGVRRSVMTREKVLIKGWIEVGFATGGKLWWWW